METIRILNNNVVHAYDDNGEEVILMGKGIAFGAKTGDIDLSKIEKTFFLNQTPLNPYMERMMQEIPEAYWGLSGIIVDYISENLNLQGSIGFVVSLVDHIYMSVKRFEKGIDIPEVFSAETKYLYPEEYKVAEHIVEIVNEYLNVKLNENEAGYIALHIIDARTEQGAMGSTFATELIRKVLEIVMGKYGEVIDTSAESYNRFLTHLKYFANRIMERQEETDRNKYGVIFDALSKDCPEQHNCVLEIREMLKREYRYLISSEEQLNLLIHVIKLTEK